SRVSDDSDLYQQFLDLPFFENDGVGGQLVDGAARMAELINEELLREGVNRFSTDALHAYEEGLNQVALMANWRYGDPIYLERCMESARGVEKLTVKFPDGRRLFPTTRSLGYENIANPPEPESDGGSTALMWHPALHAADYNRNKQAIDVMRQWADTWLRFMQPDSWAIAIDIKGNKAASVEKGRPLSGGYNSQACVFLWLHTLTGDTKYIEPFLHYYRQGKAPGPSDQFLNDVRLAGGLDVLDAGMQKKLAEFNPVLHLYETGSADRLIRSIIGNPNSGGSAVTNLHDAIRWPDMYTSSEQFTDRVIPSILYNASACYLGGITRRNKFNPARAVSWEGFGTDYGALVLDNRSDHLKVAVYSYADKEMKGGMRVWALAHGEYEVSTGTDGNGDFTIDGGRSRKTVELAKAGVLPIILKPKAVTIIEITQKKKLDPVELRADLALAAREITVSGNRISGTVHNIGSKDVSDVVIALTDAGGKVIERKSLGSLAAPNDLIAKRKAFEFNLPANIRRGWSVAVDPGGRIPEIYEGNNFVRSVDLPASDKTAARK
ncbi:MAG: hypothetical protein ACYC9O_11805, partial [Candidatus Latescibacterota bacterium]